VDTYRENLKRVEKLKERITALEQRNEILQEEKRMLGVRAAISFEELTPRFKDFEDTFKELALERPKPEYKGLDKVSSNGFVKALIQAYKQHTKQSNKHHDKPV